MDKLTIVNWMVSIIVIIISLTFENQSLMNSVWILFIDGTIPSPL